MRAVGVQASGPGPVPAWPRRARWQAACAAALWLLLATPPLRSWLQSGMLRHMLVQLPLLALAGAWLARSALASRAGRRAQRLLARWDGAGVNGALLASWASLPWMLPRVLDAAATEPGAIAAKFVVLPLLVGAPLALSWPRMGFVVRGLLLAETVAASARLGWLYLAAPTRLCTSYLLDEQQQLGRALLMFAVALALLCACWLLFGRTRPVPAPGAAVVRDGP